MKVTKFTNVELPALLREVCHLFDRRKIYSTYGSLLIMVSAILSAQTATAQDPALSNLEAAALNYDEDQIATQVTNSIDVSDMDSPLLASATVQLTLNYSSTEDVLQFTDAFSITSSYDVPTGTLTLTGPASLADFTSALRSVTYVNTNNNHPSNLSRTVSFVVNDGTYNSIPVTRSIQVNRINDKPVGIPDNFVMNEDTELDCGCLLHNDTDPDGDPIIALHGDPPSHGVVTDLGGFFVYTPDPDFYGTDSFTYYANDGTENSDPILVNVTVLPVNDAPVAFNDAASLNEDIPLGISILVNDHDVDDVLTPSMILIISTPANGTVVINPTTGVALYTPALDFFGNDSFTYQLKDASGALSNVVTVNITVNTVNDPPVAHADVITTPEEIPVTISVLTNDTDVDNALNLTSLVIVSSPSHGSVNGEADGTVVYTPVKDFNGNDSFTYTIKDVDGAISAATTVTVTVTPVNDAPVAVDDQATTDENTAVNINILLNDYDVDNSIISASVTITSNPAHGIVSFDATTGIAKYTPEEKYEGDDSFTYSIQDPEGLTSSATVSISVIPAPDKAPNAVDDGPILNVSLAPVIIDVLDNDSDEDNNHDELSIISVTNPVVGTVSIVDGKIVYQPAGLVSGKVTFSYTIQDPTGLTDEATVTIQNEYPSLLVSEGFSPNNDSNNETWYIQGIENYPNNRVKIFDRWGLLVYQKEHYNNESGPWDGRANIAQQSGKLLDQGTYYYILEPGEEIKTMTGYVVIIR